MQDKVRRYITVNPYAQLTLYYYYFIRPSITLTRVQWDTSTGNLQRHCNGCNSKVAPPGQGINDFAHGSTYSPARMRYLAALWVSRSGRPYIAIQDPDLLAILRMLYSRVEIPHPTTLSRDVREIFEMTQQNIAKELQVICVSGVVLYEN